MKQVECTEQYIKRLTEAITKGKKLTKLWDTIASKKLGNDCEKQNGDFAKEKVDMQEYATNFEKIFSTKYPNIFKRMKCIEKRYEDHIPFYTVTLSNFSFTLSFTSAFSCHEWVKVFCPCIFTYFGEYDTRYHLEVGLHLEEFIDWLVIENENMKSLRKEWDELCDNIRYGLISNNNDEDVVNSILDEKTKDLNIEVSVEKVISENHHSINLRCLSLDILFHVPGGYTDWERVIDLFVDIVKFKMKD